MRHRAPDSLDEREKASSEITLPVCRLPLDTFIHYATGYKPRPPDAEYSTESEKSNRLIKQPLTPLDFQGTL